MRIAGSNLKRIRIEPVKFPVKDKMTVVKKPALGRGLSALLSDSQTDVMTREHAPKLAGSISTILLSQIEANPFQPRTEFEKQALNELADSIRLHGIIQPITVRKTGLDKYQIISGERRVRASIIAGLKEVPAYIRVAKDQDMLEMAIIENVQRENLNPMEVALSYKRLIDECSLKQEELGERVGKDRTTVNNYIRLLKLPPEIQAGLRDGKLSMGHARALLAITDPNEQLRLYEDLLRENMSVRAIESLVKQVNESEPKKQQEPAQAKPDPELAKRIEDIQNYLSSIYQLPVFVKPRSSGKGEITIRFNTESEFERLMKMLNKS
jgi:ParB family chromosome partitioning protein